MSIAVTVVRGSQLSAPALVARGRWSARNSATAYISERCTAFWKHATKTN
jgi:hypothetical protein